MFDVCADLVIGDSPMVSHIAVVRKHEHRDVVGNFRQLSLHIVVRPGSKKNPEMATKKPRRLLPTKLT